MLLLLLPSCASQTDVLGRLRANQRRVAASLFLKQERIYNQYRRIYNQYRRVELYVECCAAEFASEVKLGSSGREEVGMSLLSALAAAPTLRSLFSPMEAATRNRSPAPSRAPGESSTALSHRANYRGRSCRTCLHARNATKSSRRTAFERERERVCGVEGEK